MDSIERKRLTLEKARQNPDFEAKRLAGVRRSLKLRNSDPEHQAKISESLKRAQDERRARGEPYVKKQRSPERIEAQREQMRRLNAEINADARRREARQKSVNESLAKTRSSGEYGAKVSAGLKAFYRRNLDAVEAIGKRLKATWENPEMRALFVERAKSPARLKRLKAAATSPRARAANAVARREAHDRKRGFKVPARVWKEYRFLIDVKKLRSAEAGRVLGLLP